MGLLRLLAVVPAFGEACGQIVIPLRPVIGLLVQVVDEVVEIADRPLGIIKAAQLLVEPAKLLRQVSF